MLRFSAILSFLLFFSTSLHSQDFQTLGWNPANMEWKIIKTPSVNVIFENGMDEEAQRVAAIIQELDKNYRRSIGDKKRKFDLLIQNKTVIPNGYVSLAPFRSEFFGTPPQNIPLVGSGNWLDVLTIHEYRHALQFMNFKKGFSAFLYILLGETGQLIANGLAIPNWFFEGDAVIYETSLTPAGRGRTADFTKGMRSLANEEIYYSYEKWRNGSYRDFVPDHYRLGYLMLTHLRNEYDNDVSGEIARRAAGYSKIFFPFSRTLKSKIGLSTPQLYREAWVNKSQEWTDKIQSLRAFPSTRLTSTPSKFTNYLWPQEAKDGTIYSAKIGFDEIGSIVSIKDEVEESIVTLGSNVDQYFSHRDGEFIWNEFSSEGRRSNVSYSDIYLFSKGEKKRISKNEKYFSPVFSPNGNSILVAEYTEDMQASLVELDKKSGKIMRSKNFGENTFLARPAYITENIWASIYRNNNRMNIIIYDVKNDEFQFVFPKGTAHIIDGLRAKEGQLIFYSDLDGIDNIYRYSIENNKLEQLTHAPIAASNPSFSKDGLSIIFNEFEIKGHYISTVPIRGKMIDFKKIKEPTEQKWMDNVAAAAEGGNILNQRFETKYKVQDYKGFFKGLKLHSWGLGGSQQVPGIRLQMNNILNDLAIIGIVGYNTNENKLNSGLNVRLAKYYPIFDFNVSNAGRSGLLVVDGDRLQLNWNESKLGLGISIPWNRLTGAYRESASFGIRSDYSFQQNIRNDMEGTFENQNFITSEIGLNYSRLIRQARQHLRPRKGFSFEARYQRSFSANNAERLIANTSIYLPGVVKTHSFLISAGYQHRVNQGFFSFADDFFYPRGFNSSIGTRSTSKLSAEYAFPLFYPEGGLPGLFYFQRIKCNAFYDFGIIEDSGAEFSPYHSIGTEWMLDLNIIRLAPQSIGIQIGYRILAPEPIQPGVFTNVLTMVNF